MDEDNPSDDGFNDKDELTDGEDESLGTDARGRGGHTVETAEIGVNTNISKMGGRKCAGCKTIIKH